MSNDVREKIITAAMTAYAESGFQGATTRRVAEIAGVNEVTIFRNFGSKAALMDEALFRRVAELKIVDPPLPLPPFAVAMFWHERYDHDPFAQWARAQVEAAVPAAG